MSVCPISGRPVFRWHVTCSTCLRKQLEIRSRRDFKPRMIYHLNVWTRSKLKRRLIKAMATVMEALGS